MKGRVDPHSTVVLVKRIPVPIEAVPHEDLMYYLKKLAFVS